MIRGTTALIAHLGYPTESFKAPMIYNPFFEKNDIDAMVIPMGCRADTFPEFLRLLFKLSNIRGALITMPHKMTTVASLDVSSTTVQVAGSCNAVRLGSSGELIGELFDGEGFVRGAMRKGRILGGARVLVVGNGGVGSAIAGSMAKACVAELALYDPQAPMMIALADRLRAHYPKLKVTVGSNDPSGWDVVVNASPLGMKDDDSLPMDVSRIAPKTFVGEVVMKEEFTPFLKAARSRGCEIQGGLDMLFEQIPAHLEFFGFPTATPEELRALATITY